MSSNKRSAPQQISRKPDAVGIIAKYTDKVYFVFRLLQSREKQMEVVKGGDRIKSSAIEAWETEITCKRRDEWDKDGDGCGAVIKITAGDLRLMYYMGTHFRHYYAGTECPECKKRLNIKVPAGMFESISIPHYFCVNG